MKIYIKLTDNSEYNFRSVAQLRKSIFYKTNTYYPSIIKGIESVYGKISLLMLGNIRII